MAATVQDLDQAGFRHFYKNAHTVLMEWSKFRLQSDMGYVNGNSKERAHNWLEKKEEVEHFWPRMELEWSDSFVIDDIIMKKKKTKKEEEEHFFFDLT